MEFQNRKLENSIFISVILFIFKILFPLSDSFILLFVNEILILITLISWIYYVSDFINPKLSKPLSLIVNVGILNAVIFFISTISNFLFTEVKDFNKNLNLMYVLFASLFSLIFIGFISYIFSVLKKLCFHRQKKDPTLYFNTMFVFFILTSFSATFFNSENKLFTNFQFTFDLNLDFVHNAFYVVTIILVVINSLRVAWIAFLNKKQKIQLIILSIVISVLCWINSSAIASEEYFVLKQFSPALTEFSGLIMIYGGIYFTIIFFISLFHLPTAELIDSKTEEITSFTNLSQLMNQVFDFDDLSETITTLTKKVSNSDASWLALLDNDEIELHSLQGISLTDANNISTFVIKNKSNLSNEVKIIDLSSLNNKGNLPKSIKSIICAPLLMHNTIRGYLFAARKTAQIFEEESISVNTYAGFASVALENAKLITESIEKERLEKEFEVAREVQYKILPQKTPNFKNLEISALFIPALEVGGDYYDFFNIDDNRLGLVIADVSGKGIEAAFIMAEVKGIFSTLSKLKLSSKEILIKANSILENSLSKKTFVTAIYGIIDLSKRTFSFARAGHSPILYFRNNEIEKLIPNGIGLGLDYSERFKESLVEMEIKLNNNDIIVLFTDGINESLNENMEEFGYERINKLVKENSLLSVEELSNLIMQAVSTFSRRNNQHDDITLVILKWKNHENKIGVN